MNPDTSRPRARSRISLLPALPCTLAFLLGSPIAEAGVIRIAPPGTAGLDTTIAWYAPAETVVVSGYYTAGDDTSLAGAAKSLLSNIALLAGAPSWNKEEPGDSVAVVERLYQIDTADRLSEWFLAHADLEPPDFFGLRPADEVQPITLFDHPPGESIACTLFACFTADELAALKKAALAAAKSYRGGEGASRSAPDPTALPPGRTMTLTVSREEGGAEPGFDFGDAPDPDPVDCAQRVYPPEVCALHYPSRLASDGAHHGDPDRAWLGDNADREEDSRQIDRDRFDDGYREGMVTIYNFDWDDTLYLNVLIDGNGDGDWEDPGEWAYRNEAWLIPTRESRDMPIVVPRGRWFRVTLTGAPIPWYDGHGFFPIGETEDYILPPLEEEPPEEPSVIPPFIPDTTTTPPGRPVPEEPKPLPRRRFYSTPGFPCEYYGGPCAKCMHDKCRACYGESCVKIRGESKGYWEKTVPMVTKLNELQKKFAAAKQKDPNGAARWKLQGEWAELHRKLKELDRKIAGAERRLKACEKACKERIVDECRDVCGGYHKGDRFEDPLPPKRHCKAYTTGIVNPALDDPAKKKKAIEALTKGEPQKGALQYLLWKMQVATDPRYLEARKEGVTRRPDSLDGGAQTVRIPLQPWFEPRERIDDNCCRWVRVDHSQVIRYRIVMKGIHYDFDFLLTVLDLQGFKAYARGILEKIFWWIPGEGTTTLSGNLFGRGLKGLWAAGWNNPASVGLYIATSLATAAGHMPAAVVGTAANIYWAGVGIGNLAAHFTKEIAGMANRFRSYDSLEVGKIEYVGNFTWVVRMKGSRFVPTEICFIPEDSWVEIDGEKTVGTFPCAELNSRVTMLVRKKVHNGCARSEAALSPAGDVTLADVVPVEGNNPFDPYDPLGTVEEILTGTPGDTTRSGDGGDSTGTEEPPDTNGTGDTTDAGGSFPPCSAGPVAIDGEFLGVTFYYNESTGECAIRSGVEQPPGFGGYLFFIRPPYNGNPSGLLVGNSYWSLVSSSAGTVTPGQFGNIDGYPLDAPFTVTVRCDMCEGAPVYTCSVVVFAEGAAVNDFKKVE